MHIEHIEGLDAFEEELANARSTTASGRQANSRGKLLGQFMKKLAGATSPRGLGDNYGVIDGHPSRFTNARGKDFTVNPESKTLTVILGSYKKVATAEEPMQVKIVGLRFADCVNYGSAVRGMGTKRLSVKLASLPRGTVTMLGIAFVPARLTEAQSVEEREQMEKVIEALTEDELGSMVVAPTRQNIRAYVTHAGGEVDTPPTPPTTEERPSADGERPDAVAGNEPGISGTDDSGA